MEFGQIILGKKMKNEKYFFGKKSQKLSNGLNFAPKIFPDHDHHVKGQCSGVLQICRDMFPKLARNENEFPIGICL